MARKQSDLVSFPIHVSSEVVRLLDEMIHRPWGFCRDMRGWNPRGPLQNRERIRFGAGLPGVKLENINIAIENSELLLQGSRALEKTHGGDHFHTMERSSGYFIRRMKLPEPIDAARMDSRVTGGCVARDHTESQQT